MNKQLYRVRYYTSKHWHLTKPMSLECAEMVKEILSGFYLGTKFNARIEEVTE